MSTTNLVQTQKTQNVVDLANQSPNTKLVPLKLERRKISPEDQITAIKAKQAQLSKHDTKTSIDIRTTVTMTQKSN